MESLFKLVSFFKLLIEKLIPIKNNAALHVNIELLEKHQQRLEDCSLHIRAQILAIVYGGGQILPLAFQKLAKQSHDQVFVLSLYPKIWNFLSFSEDGGMKIRSDLEDSGKRKRFLFWCELIGIVFTAISIVVIPSFFVSLLDNTKKFSEFNATSMPMSIGLLIAAFLLPFGLVILFKMSSKLSALDDLIRLVPEVIKNTSLKKPNE
jgi:hypothetical protein